MNVHMESMVKHAGKSQTGHVQQLFFELLRVVREIGNSVHHLLDGRRVWVVQGGRFSRRHHRL